MLPPEELFLDIFFGFPLKSTSPPLEAFASIFSEAKTSISAPLAALTITLLLFKLYAFIELPLEALDA